MKKTFLVILLIIIGVIATFFLNSNFRDLIISSTKEASHQLGKLSPPIVHVTSDYTQHDENQTSITNKYDLLLLNTNKEQRLYKIQVVNNDSYILSISNSVLIKPGEHKHIVFNIQIPKNSIDTTQRVAQITLRVIDTENPELFTDDTTEFVFKGF